MLILKKIFDDFKTIYLVGIKGIAMTGLATIFHEMGKNVIGSDVNDSFITDDILQKNSIKMLSGFKKENINSNIDLVIYSASHQGRENPEVVEAKHRCVRVMHQAEAIGSLFVYFKTNIAITGSHGKTTTSSLLAYTLTKLGKQPSYLIGTSEFNGYQGANYANQEYFVVEADEYGVDPPHDKTPKFFFFEPDFIIATNVDYDHPDVYQDIQSVKDSFFNFFLKLKEKKKTEPRLFYCVDDKNLVGVVEMLPRELSLSYGFSSKADLRIVNVVTDKNRSNFELIFQGNKLGSFGTSLFGNKNISNISGIILFLLSQGVDREKIKKAIVGFTGAKRRFEQVAKVKNIYLFDDYAHHPEEIKATINAAKMKFPGKRIVLIFQPHTFSRTYYLKTEFASALKETSLAFILPIFPSAREKFDVYKIGSFDIATIAKKYHQGQVIAVKDKNEMLNKLQKEIKHGDIIFTIGAGDVYKLKDDIIKTIKTLIK